MKTWWRRKIEDAYELNILDSCSDLGCPYYSYENDNDVQARDYEHEQFWAIKQGYGIGINEEANI
jgi:hypothetical protein